MTQQNYLTNLTSESKFFTFFMNFSDLENIGSRCYTSRNILQHFYFLYSNQLTNWELKTVKGVVCYSQFIDHNNDIIKFLFTIGNSKTMATAQDKDEQKKIEHLNNDLLDHLKNLPKVENFAHTLHSIYYKKLDSSVENKDDAKRLKKIQKQARKDAFLFLKIILPLMEKILTFIQNFFEEYDDSYKEWEKELKIILTDVEENAENTRVVGMLSEKLMAEAKDAEKQTTSLLKKIQLDDNYEKDIDTLRMEAQSYKDKTTGDDNLIFKVYNEIKEKRCSKKAAELTDHREEWLQKHFYAEINDISNALSNFIASIKGIATFFSLIHKDIEKCITLLGSERDRKKKNHFEATKKKSKDIKYQIQVCFISLPNIRSSLDAIPKTGIDQNCVQNWVNDNLKEIVNREKIDSLSKFLSVTIPSIEWTQALFAIRDK